MNNQRFEDNKMQELPVQMHRQYPYFVKFMADCPHRKTPECMQTAFWAWLTLSEQFSDYLESSTKTIQMLSIDKKMMKGELDALKRMNAALTESNDILKTALNEVSE